jgi:tRNA U34 5-carboxymethylaminomethyl modifying GTPase MnmE/TrmE
MARNNHQTSETARAGVRETTDRAEDVMQTGIQAARRVAEEFGRVLGVRGQNENLTRQASQNLEAITETGSVLIRGFQDGSREWLELTQERLRKNAERMTKLAQCRTLPDLAAFQSDLAPLQWPRIGRLSCAFSLRSHSLGLY